MITGSHFGELLTRSSATQLMQAGHRGAVLINDLRIKHLHVTQ
jgi:hypothetical protein